MRYLTRKVTLNIHGLEIKTQQRGYPCYTSGDNHWSNTVTIPKNMLRKIIALGESKVRVRCTGIYTDDYAFDAAYNYRKGDVPLDAQLFTRPDWNIFTRNISVVAHLDGTGRIHFGPGHWEGYDLYPIDGAITMTVRE